MSRFSLGLGLLLALGAPHARADLPPIPQNPPTPRPTAPPTPTDPPSSSGETTNEDGSNSSFPTGAAIAAAIAIYVGMRMRRREPPIDAEAPR